MDNFQKGYAKRCIDFFLVSIQSLKKQSGGQRWNTICEDAVDLFFARYSHSLEETLFTKHELWSFLFDPSTRNPTFILFENACKDPKFIEFFFHILHSLLDPPPSWWRDQFR